MASSTGTTTAAVNLRSGPGTTFARLTALVPGTALTVLGQQGDWLQVQVGPQPGYVHKNYVTVAGAVPVSAAVSAPGVAPAPAASPAPQPPAAPAVIPAPAPIPAPGGVSPKDAPLEPLPSEQINTIPKDADRTTRLAAQTWNKFGGVFKALGTSLGIDPGLAVAVFVLESGGRTFHADGRMIIRFENQVFFDLWGKQRPDIYQQHFTFNAEKRWLEHMWRPAADQSWRAAHTEHNEEWLELTFARTLDDTAALQSISMGGAQIMGFNYKMLAYPSVQAMFQACSTSDRAQIVGFFDFIKGPSAATSKRVAALQTKDYAAFAALYNGPGQAQRYGGLIKMVYDAFLKLKPA
jgi:hypothetical protein